MSWFAGLFGSGTAQQNKAAFNNNYGTITLINSVGGAAVPIELRVPWNPVASIENPSPSQLLTWHGRLTPLLGRTPELAALQRWVDTSANVSVWILAGEGGIGKTRLAAEFAEALIAKKWSAGFVDLARFNDAASLTLDARTLLLVDYPEERPDQLARLFDLLKRHTGPPKLRVALLTRSAPDVKKRLAERSATHLEYNEPWSFVAGSVQPYALFRAAFAAVRSDGPAKLPYELAFNGWLARSPLHTSALFIVAAALIAREQGAGQLELVGYHVLAQIARDEMAKIKRAAGGDAQAANAAVDAVALATAFDGVTLAGLRGLTSATKLGFAATALRQTLLSTQHATELMASVCDVLRLEPDLYAAAFLNEWHHTHWNSDTHDCLNSAFADLWAAGSVAMVLPHWNRLAYDMTSRLGQSRNWMDDWLCDATQKENVSVSAFTHALADGTWFGLPHAPIEIGKRVIAALGGEGEAALAERGRLFHNASVDMAHAGDRAGALEAARQGLAIRRDLVRINPAAYEPNLAISLNNLAHYLEVTGDHTGALAAAREALTIYRRLTQAEPAAYLPDLAMSMNNLACFLSEMGDHTAALEMASEAATIRRRLAQDRPALYESDLASSLHNLANRLGDLGDIAGALDVAHEAVTIRRRRVLANPALEERLLAATLNSLATLLDKTSSRAEALDASSEAVAIYRRLAQASPTAFDADLAMSVANLAIMLSEMGDNAGALTASREAVAIYRRLAVADPAAYEWDLASGINNLANRLLQSGYRAESLDAAREAVMIYRRFAHANPRACEPDLARSLYVLAFALSEDGQKKLASEAAAEAVTRVRPWAARFPEAYSDLLGVAEVLVAELDAS